MHPEGGVDGVVGGLAFGGRCLPPQGGHGVRMLGVDPVALLRRCLLSGVSGHVS